MTFPASVPAALAAVLLAVPVHAPGAGSPNSPQGKPADFDRADLVVAMDSSNEEELLGLARTAQDCAKVVRLGAFAGATGAVSLGALTAAIRERFSGPTAEGNAAAAEAAFAGEAAPC